MSRYLSNEILQLEPSGLAHTKTFTLAFNSSRANIQKWLGGAMALALDESGSISDFIVDYEQSWANGTKYGFFVRELASDRCVGFGFLNSINQTHKFANLGYWVSTDAAGQGYATQITKLLATYSSDSLGLYRLELVIEPENLASIRVAEKAGAVREGLQRTRLFGKDAFMYSIVKKRENASAE